MAHDDAEEGHLHAPTTGARAAARAAGYQWRAWGDIDEASCLLAGFGAEWVTERRRDIYLLGTNRTHNVKVRGHRLEINELVGEPLGFQQWTRAVLHVLPCPADEAHRILDEITTAGGELSPDGRMGRRRLLDAAEQRGLQPVTVLKHRTRYALGPLRAEVTSMTIEAGPRSTGGVELACVAIEGPDLHPLLMLRSQLRLERFVNTAVPVALERALAVHSR